MSKSQCALVVAVALLAGLVGGALSGRLASADAPGLVIAREIRLVDMDGDTRAEMKVLADGGVAMNLLWLNGKPAMSLVADGKGNSRIFVADERGVMRSGLASLSGGLSGMVVNDRRGMMRGAFMERGDTVQLAMNRTASPKRFATKLMVNHRGHPSLSMTDPMGHNRIFLALGKEHKPLLWAMDAQGKRVWFAPREDN